MHDRGDMVHTDQDSAPADAGPAGLMQIGAIAQLVGLSLRTVRYYEEAGLVLPAGRTPGGFRLYDNDAVERLRLIMKMKPLGFTLDEMRLLIETLDELAVGTADDMQLRAARDRLEMFSIAATTRVTQLQEQLQIAEAFSEILANEVARQPGDGPSSAGPDAPAGTDAPPVAGAPPVPEGPQTP